MSQIWVWNTRENPPQYNVKNTKTVIWVTPTVKSQIFPHIDYLKKIYKWVWANKFSWRMKDQLDVTCFFFFFTSYVLNMFRTWIYTLSGACDCVVELPHRSPCSQFVVCWRFVAAGVEWCSFCRLKHKWCSFCRLKHKLCFSLQNEHHSTPGALIMFSQQMAQALL